MESFLEYVEKYEYVGKAFQMYLTERFRVKPDFFSYKHNVKNAPQVCIKVPTAGGKTFIAVNALRSIFENFAQAQSKVVVWLVPSMNDFEAKVINEIANLENVVFWHKIIERKGFKLNGFVNHYPDFLILTKSGKTLLVESKGDNLDNSDSVNKLKLGQLWASKAGNNFRYFMVFDQNPIENAHKLDEIIKIIAEL